MIKKYSALLFLIMIFGCSKKHQPQSDNVNNKTEYEKKVIINPHERLPQMLTVEDKVASKSVDGRLYFDLNGRRYWKNYNDGRYYLFNKSMYKNPAFKPH
jgi:hypothetical protein